MNKTVPLQIDPSLISTVLDTLHSDRSVLYCGGKLLQATFFPKDEATAQGRVVLVQRDRGPSTEYVVWWQNLEDLTNPYCTQGTYFDDDKDAAEAFYKKRIEAITRIYEARGLTVAPC